MSSDLLTATEELASRGGLWEKWMAVAKKTHGIPKWVALVSGNMDPHLRFALSV